MTGRVDVDEPIYQKQFRQYEKDFYQIIKEDYIRYLIDDGLSEEALKRTIEAIETIDANQENQYPSEIWQDMLSKADKRIEKWCASLDICVDDLTEEQMMQLVSEGVKKVRLMKNEAK